MPLYRLAFCLVLLLLSGCAVQPLRLAALVSAYSEGEGRLAECAALFARVDELGLISATLDAQSTRLPAFPYLRVDRLLASFRDELQTPEQTLAWLTAMRELDRKGRSIEWQNMPAHARAELAADLPARLETCADLMLAADSGDAGRLAAIRQAAVVADSYIQANRVLGLYPLSSLLVRRGVTRLQREIRTGFAGAGQGAGGHEHMLRFAPPATTLNADDVAGILHAARRDALRRPVFSAADEAALFNYFAPVWELEVTGAEDRFGVPYWTADKTLALQTNQGLVYRHLSFTRVKDQVLPQFNYIIWFPSRPASGPFDILAGHLDGITWRVTVATDGTALMFDAMHNCGCYHMFFPAGAAQLHDTHGQAGEEPVLVPQRAPMPGSGERMHVRVAALSHYIEGLRIREPAVDDLVYGFADYDVLRSMPLAGGGHRSMFGMDGLVAGTSRKERWLLWPMGVADAGAMRQWGHHATAFIGKRHFDDARLLERYFSLPRVQRDSIARNKAPGIAAGNQPDG